MNNHKPLIVISNDDGYSAPGINALIEMVRVLDADIVVCAPDGARSGYSCAFSATESLRLKPISHEGNVQVWSCNGTPVDCVKLAIHRLCDGRTPDMVIGGINHGDNSTVNNHYSGTMGVAMEGCMKYIPSVAFSSCDYDPKADLSPLTPYVQRIVHKILAEGLPKGICLNVNFPKGKDFKGVKACRMTFGRWVNEVFSCQHPRGYEYHWMVGEYANDEPDAEDSDQWALNHRYVAITPTKMDVTAYEYLDKLRQWAEE